MPRSLLRVAAAATIVATLAWAIHGGLEAPGFSARMSWGALAVLPYSIICLALVALGLSILSGGSVRYRHAFKAVSLMMPLFLLLPSRLSEIVKPLYLLSAAKLPLTKGVAVVAVERFLDVICVAVLIVVAATLAVPNAAGPLQFAAVVFASIAAAGLAGIAVMLVMPGSINRFLDWMPFARLRSVMRSLFLAARETVSPPRLGSALIVCGLTWTSSYASFWTFLRVAGHQPLSWSETLQVFVISTIGLAVAVAPGGLGTFEAAVMIGLSAHGYGLSEAAILAVVFRLANLVPSTVVVVVMVLRDEINLAALIRRARGQLDTS